MVRVHVKSKRKMHSWPAWALGPRSAHPKFGGSITIGGIARVDTRLQVIKSNFPDDLTSCHLLHELMEDGDYAQFNNPNAISWPDLVRGIEEGRYPRIAALTVPAFGIPGVENGALLSPNKDIADMYYNMHVTSILKTKWLKQQNLGEGVYIWWPAFDSQRKYHGANPQFSINEAWDKLIEIWYGICDEVLDKTDTSPAGNEPLVWLEWKPEVPGQDYINTLTRAIQFCGEVNSKVGGRVMAINNEWAHLLIGGTTVEDGTRRTIEAGLFTGFLHANSADKAIVSIDDTTGEVIEGTPGDDRDWFVGAGGQNRWDDQQRAVKLLVESDLPLIIEHDIDPGGDDPLLYYKTSRSNFEQMLNS